MSFPAAVPATASTPESNFQAEVMSQHSMKTTDVENGPKNTLRSRATGLSLQQKSWLITIVVLLALAALLTLGIDRVFRQGSERSERRWLADCVRRVDIYQTSEADALERTVRDYATWTAG